MGMIMKNGKPYGQGCAIPPGGKKGQVFSKASDLDGDTEWRDEEGGGGGETPTLDAVLKKGNETESNARFTGLESVTEVGDTGTYMTGVGTEGMRQVNVNQNGIRAVDNLVGTITPKFVVPFEPSGEDQVAMSNAVKASFKKALGIANDAFVFDVDSDQFTPDPDNPDGKHYGVTITSPTYDELLAMLQTDTFVYVRLLYNSGKAYEIMQLFHNMNSIYGRYFDVEFPQKRLQFASAYVNKRTNNETYFGTYQDYIGGSGDAYTKAETDALLANVVGDLDTLTTTDKTSAVGAINELDAAVKGLGEPFRVKNWASNTLNVEIPYCTEDIGNGSIAKMIFSIDDVEGAEYQIVGMIAYEVFDAASGGNRINCWPVCQFTGNGQKELSVRWMCAGTTRKTAKRINAWVLLKHR